jgi:glycosyltransferase involved in cell wall biosynthesis
MKVLQIINSLGTGGAEKLLLDTIPRYVAQGIEMDILLLDSKKTPFFQQLEALKCCNIYHATKDSSVYSPRHIRAIIPFLKKYDLAHVHLFPAQYWAVLAKKLSGANIKLIFTEHNTTNRRLEHPLLRRIDKLLYQYYDRTVCITSGIRDVLVKHTGLPQARFPVIENGVDLVKIKEAASMSKSAIHQQLKDEDTLLIQVAGFREQKDQATLIRTVAHLPQHVKLLLVGDGITRPTCEALVDTLGLRDRVLFLGQRTDVARLLKSADIVVLSSHYEGLSLSSIEGMASGKPFVASNVPGLKEVVGGAGLLFDQGDDAGLAEVLSKLIEDKEWYNQIAAQCVQRAEQYDIQKMVNQHIELYEYICA